MVRFLICIGSQALDSIQDQTNGHSRSYFSFLWFSLFFIKNQLCSGIIYMGFPRWHSGKDSAWNAGDAGSTPASERSPGEANGNPL